MKERGRKEGEGDRSAGTAVRKQPSCKASLCHGPKFQCDSMGCGYAPLKEKKWKWRPEVHDADFTAQMRILIYKTEQ